MGGKSDFSDTEFLAWHRWDRQFFLFYTLAAWGAVLVGFFPSVSARFDGHADYPAPVILQLHVFAFTAWLCLLTAQIMLVRTGRRHIHQLLGFAGAALIPILVVTGIGAELHSQRFYSPSNPENLQFFVAPLIEMLVFGLCAAAALLLRTAPSAHKRLILLATSMILSAGYNRGLGDIFDQMFGDGFWGMIGNNFSGPNFLMAIAMVYDGVTRHRLHPAYKVAVPLIVLAELIASFVYHHPAWPPIAKEIIGI